MSTATPETVDYTKQSNLEILLEEIMPYEDSDDPNRRTHIVNAEMNQHLGMPDASAQELVDTARMTGQEIISLCGHKWVPVHNPEKYDACKSCVKIAEILMRKAGQ